MNGMQMMLKAFGLQLPEDFDIGKFFSDFQNLVQFVHDGVIRNDAKLDTILENQRQILERLGHVGSTGRTELDYAGGGIPIVTPADGTGAGRANGIGGSGSGADDITRQHQIE